MTNFLLDLWHDLRAKRLWPVAAVLALALVAMPVLLKKSSSDAGPAPAASPSQSASAAANGKPVVVADTGTTKASNLGVFDPKNPFRPDHMPKAPGSTTSPSSSAPSTTTQAPSSGGGGSTGSAPSTPPSSGGVPSQPTQPKSGSYAYTVDVKFGKRGDLRTRHGLQKLDLLPNANNPLLVFLGVNAAGDTAVFLTDTSLKAAGEGTCKPSDDVCSFLYLKVDDGQNTEDLSEQASDGTGTEYTLKLLAIHKVPVSKLAKKSQSKAAKKAAARRARQLRHKPGTPFHLLFTLPQLPDVVG
jgi:hypothetical protein